MVTLPTGATLFADSEAHQILRLQGGRVDPLSVPISFPVGPFALAYAPDTGELFIAGDNRVHVLPIDADGGIGAASTVAGQSCGGSCPGFNGDGAAGTLTALAFPTGLDVDPSYVYFADRDNCRVRRFRRSDATHAVETFAGTVCDPGGDAFAGSADGFRAPGQLRLGRVTDVHYGQDGSVYFVDASHCAVIQVVAPALSTARVVAGSRFGCNQPPVAGLALGRIGGLAMSADRSSFYLSDTEFQRIVRVDNTVNGGTPMHRVVFEPGASPMPGEDPATWRVGRPSGLGMAGDGTTLFVAGRAEGRLYAIAGSVSSVLLGVGGTTPTMDPVTASTLPPTLVAGIGTDGTRTVLGFPDRGVVADLSAPGAGSYTLTRVAGRYTGELVDAGAPSRDAGAVPATDASFARPSWPFAQDGGVWFGDTTGRVWRVTVTGDGGVAEPFAGSGALTPGGVPDGGSIAATAASLGSVVAFAMDRAGTLYVADPARYVVWSIDATGQARIVAGVLDRPAPLADDMNPATTVGIAQPTALAYDGADTLYIADAAANRIRALGISTGRMATVAGSGASSGSAPAPTGDNGPARVATLSQPVALAFANGHLWVAEGASGRVRRITFP